MRVSIKRYGEGPVLIERERERQRDLGYVWFPKSTKKKNVKENYFLIFGYLLENTKKNQI